MMTMRLMRKNAKKGVNEMRQEEEGVKDRGEAVTVEGAMRRAARGRHKAAERMRHSNKCKHEVRYATSAVRDRSGDRL